MANLPAGYVEERGYGMINYCIPLSRYPTTYNKLPLCYASPAAQWNHNALYLMCAYGDPGALERPEAAFRSAGKKLDMGKSCVRFQENRLFRVSRR